MTWHKPSFRMEWNWPMMGCGWSWEMSAKIHTQRMSHAWSTALIDSTSISPMGLLFLFGALLLSGLASPAAPADRGDEVIIVYNTRIPESKALAEYYAQKRSVPTNQIFGLELSTTEEMSRAEFRDNLQDPLARQIAA